MAKKVKSIEASKIDESESDFIIRWTLPTSKSKTYWTKYIKEYKVTFKYYTHTNNGWRWVTDSSTTTSSTHTTYSVPDVASYFKVYVRPISKTHKKNGKNVSYFTADTKSQLVNVVKYTYAKPEPPSVSVSLNEDGSKLTVSCSNLDSDVNYIQFELFANSKSQEVSKEIKIASGSVSYDFDLSVGVKYKVRAKAINTIKYKRPSNGKYVTKKIFSDWSEYTSEFFSRPAPPTNFKATVKSANSVYLIWNKCETATKYEIWYADNADDMETQSGSSFRKTETESNDSRIIISGLEAGKKWFFRVRAVNSGGYSDWWKNPSDPKDLTQMVILGTKPSAPTTWSSAMVAKINSTETVNLYWVHNSEDGSAERYARLELAKNDDPPMPSIELENTNRDDYGEYEDKTQVYTINTRDYSDGDELKWRVCTKGIWSDSNTGDGYGDWSIERSIKFYEEPSLVIDVLDQNGNPLAQDDESSRIITQFPINIKCATFPETANPIGFSISVEAMDSYLIDEDTSSSIYISAGDSVYQKYIDGNSGDISLTVDDLNLKNTCRYKIVGVANFDSGLTATTVDDEKIYTVNFDINLDKYDLDYTEIIPDFDTLSVIVKPKCYINDGTTDVPETTEENLIEPEGIVMSVYRREVNGKFTEIGTGAYNNSFAFLDPHPSLDIARYRIVVKEKATGAMTYDDINYELGESSIVISWNEEWSTLANDETDDPTDFIPVLNGSMVVLPYNIDVSESNSIDVSLIEYIGRERPVSYYGTQLGENPQWNCEIPKSDTETIYQLRRLAVYKGDVYVREPSGTGFWANISVSFNLKHTDLTVPVTLIIKPVEGGM